MRTDNMPQGWQWLTGDVSWDDYGGMWYKRAKSGRYFVVRFDNGHGHDSSLPRYLASVVSVDVDALMSDSKRLASVLSCVGMRMVNGALLTDQGEEIMAQYVKLAILEAAIAHGAYAPHTEHSGEHYPLRVRAEARRAAETLIRDEHALAESLERPVNAICTSAADYERGNLWGSQ